MDVVRVVGEGGELEELAVAEGGFVDEGGDVGACIELC